MKEKTDLRYKIKGAKVYDKPYGNFDNGVFRGNWNENLKDMMFFIKFFSLLLQCIEFYNW